jgi:hypothetical protein
MVLFAALTLEFRVVLLVKLAKMPAAVPTILLDAAFAIGLASSVCEVWDNNVEHICRDDGNIPRSPPEHNGVIVCRYERDRTSTPRGAWSAAVATL